MVLLLGLRIVVRRLLVYDRNSALKLQSTHKSAFAPYYLYMHSTQQKKKKLEPRSGAGFAATLTSMFCAEAQRGTNMPDGCRPHDQPIPAFKYIVRSLFTERRNTKILMYLCALSGR